MNTFESVGIVKYDPVVERGTFRPHWVILKCDKEIVRYYQHIFYKLYWKKLQTAMWGGHISINRGECPKNIENWKLFDGKKIKFEYKYNGEFLTNGKHFWIECFSDAFSDIRLSLGLPENPRIGYHLSIGSLEVKK